MSSGFSMGAQSRPLQRSLPGSVAPGQRPAQHRTPSQTHITSSPSQKHLPADQPGESPDMSQTRHATTPRLGGSRLRQEISSDFNAGTPSATASPQSSTPSRMMPISESADGDISSPALSRSSHHDSDNAPLPMPRRRLPFLRHVPSTRSATSSSTTAKRDVKPKPYTIETPSAAPRYQWSNKNETVFRDPFSRGLNSGFADFFPWYGNHHEDEWSTEAIQKGTWDRGTQNETSSARLAVLPALKQKTGLSALSTIFMGVLNQRRNSGQITAPSTFKPPPRVTLTDTKREIWLKDLANPAISLRRLSRTIPHGIRGRTLLDQCLNKNVPSERAVWLAKCVGANEIRAFKRKGVNGVFIMGGELKWIRDWTVFVEQFVEAVVSAFGEADWKQRVTYAIRLATILYTEHLLDREHYLDWIITGLEHSPQSRIPMWILIAQICWTDILRSRKFGRRLVFALLAHLDTVHNDPDKDILIQLSSQLTSLLSSLLKNSPESFVCPSLWPKFEKSLRAFLPMDDTVIEQIFREISNRNTYLLISNTTSPHVGSQLLVKLLDATLPGVIEPDLATKCWACHDDKSGILRTVVDWATSPHRPGLFKVYVASNLLKQWSELRLNITTAILETLDTIVAGDRIRPSMMYHLVSELVRTGHFSVSQYIQWLIARGSCHDPAEIDLETGSCASRLLVELPIHYLSEERKRDRANLLRRAANYNVNDEDRDIGNAIAVVSQSVGLTECSPGENKSIPIRKLLTRVRNSSIALKTTLGAYLQETLMDKHLAQADSTLSFAVFSSVRTVLETTEDYSVLADVLKSCTKSSNIEVLTSCVDTVHANLAVFFALGQTTNLCDMLLGRLKALSREHGLIIRPFLSALSTLAGHIPSYHDVAKQLQQELLQNDKTSALDACSPVSDNMISQSQGVEGEVSDQIDKLLASGTNIDPPTMNRLFRNIIPKLEAGWNKLDDSRRVFGSLLGRLRILDAQHFDRLMFDWVSHIRTMKTRKSLSELYPLLLTLGCLSLSTMLQTASTALAPSDLEGIDFENIMPGSATYLQELLGLLFAERLRSDSLLAAENYRFRIYQHTAQFEHPKGLLLLIGNAIAEYSLLKSHAAAHLLFDGQLFQEKTFALLRYLVVVDPSAVAEVLKSRDLPVNASDFIRNIVSKLLIPSKACNSETSFDRILSLANELTMPFCQLTLNLELSFGNIGSTDKEDQSGSQFDVFAKAMDSAIEARNITWTSMLPCLSEDITQHLKSQAQSRFLDLIPNGKSKDLTDIASSEDRIHLARNLLGVLEAIISGQQAYKPAHLSPVLVDKLTELWDILAGSDAGSLNGACTSILEHWLPVLLKFVALHGSAVESAGASTSATVAVKTVVTTNLEARARTAVVLCGILFELESRWFTSSSALSQRIFDTALVLVDGLPDELKAHCARAIIAAPSTIPSKFATSDPRIQYLFSVLPAAAADNLMLAHRDKASLPHSAAARGLGAMYGIGPTTQEKFSPFVSRRWEILSEPTPNVGENDTSLSLGLFEAIKIQ